MTSSQGKNARDSSLDTCKQQSANDVFVKSISLVTQRSRCYSQSPADNCKGAEMAPIQPQCPVEKSTVQPSQNISHDLAKLMARKKAKIDSAEAADTAEGKDSKPAAMYSDRTAKAKKQQSILRKIRYLLPQLLLQKSDVCKHDHGCFENVIRKALVNFMSGFGIIFIMKNLMLLAKPAKFLKNLRNMRTLVDATRFGLFLMVFNSSYKLLLCLLRRLGCKDDKVNAPIAGFISALSIAIDSGSRRELLAVLMMSRFIESSLNLGETTGTIPKFKYRNVMFWVITNTFLQSAMAMNQSILNAGLRKFFADKSRMSENQLIMVDVWSRMLRDGVPTF